MTRNAIFWVLMLLWLLASFWVGWPYDRPILVMPNLLQFVLFALIGWQVFGPAVKG